MGGSFWQKDNLVTVILFELQHTYAYYDIEPSRKFDAPPSSLATLI